MGMVRACFQRNICGFDQAISIYSNTMVAIYNHFGSLSSIDDSSFDDQANDTCQQDVPSFTKYSIGYKFVQAL